MFKVLFRDREAEKVIIGDVDTSDAVLVKIHTQRGDTVFVNKTAIIFMKELSHDND